MSRKRFFLGAVLSIVLGAMVAVGTISAADGRTRVSRDRRSGISSGGTTSWAPGRRP